MSDETLRILSADGKPVTSDKRIDRCPHCAAGRQYLMNRAGFGPAKVMVCTVCGQVAGEEPIHVS